MTAIKQLSIKEPRVQAYETYVVTNDEYGEGYPIYIFVPIWQPYGKNPRWIKYLPVTKGFETFYYNATEVKNFIKQLYNYDDANKIKLYGMSSNWGEYLPFKLENQSELQRDLVAATTLKGRRTSAPRTPRTLRAPVKKTSAKTHAKRR